MILRPALAGLGLLLALTACAYPVATLEQGSPASGFYFPGARADARVTLDGAAAGLAATYDGRKALLTAPPGPHRVRILAGGATLYDQSVFLGPGARLAIKAP